MDLPTVAIGKRVSVALTTYNGSNYLREQLDSILRQTCQADEIVICDDCSTDDTRVILEQYVNLYPVFRVYYNDKEPRI